MASKKSKAAPTDDELNKLLEGIGEDDAPAKATAGKAAAKGANAAKAQTEKDLLAELENLGAQPGSRPQTPRVQAGKRTTATPPLSSSQPGDEKTAGPRKSGDSSRSFHTSFTPSATSSELQEAEKKAPIAQPAEAASTGGGWWGGIFATASAAVKTAEAAVKEIQQNEEAKRWAEQVKGNVGALRGFGKVVVAAWNHVLTQHRRGATIKSTSNIHQYPPHACTAHLIPRTTPDPHHPRLHRLPFPGPPHLLDLLEGHGPG